MDVSHLLYRVLTRCNAFLLASGVLVVSLHYQLADFNYIALRDIFDWHCSCHVFDVASSYYVTCIVYYIFTYIQKYFIYYFTYTFTSIMATSRSEVA